MLKFGDFVLKLLKTNVRFEISTFEIVYKQNLAKLTKLKLFGPKCTNLGIWFKVFEDQCQI